MICPRCDTPHQHEELTRHGYSRSSVYGCSRCGLFRGHNYTYIHTVKYLAYIYDTGNTMVLSRKTGYTLANIPKAISVKAIEEDIDKLLALLA